MDKITNILIKNLNRQYSDLVRSLYETMVSIGGYTFHNGIDPIELLTFDGNVYNVVGYTIGKHDMVVFKCVDDKHEKQDIMYYETDYIKIYYEILSTIQEIEFPDED